MIRAVPLALGILCASAFGTAQGTQQPQGQPPQQGQGQQGQGRQPQQGQNQQPQQAGPSDQPSVGRPDWDRWAGRPYVRPPDKIPSRPCPSREDNAALAKRFVDWLEAYIALNAAIDVKDRLAKASAAADEQLRAAQTAYNAALGNYGELQAARADYNRARADYQAGDLTDDEASGAIAAYFFAALAHANDEQNLKTAEQNLKTAEAAAKQAEDALVAADASVAKLEGKDKQAESEYKTELEKQQKKSCPEHSAAPPGGNSPAVPAPQPQPRRLGDKPGELRPTEQVMVRREPGRPPTPVEVVPAPQTAIIATDRKQWCTFGLARGVATVLTPIDAKANLIASVAPAEAAATAKTTPSATDRPTSTPSTPRALTELPKEVAPPPIASLLPRARPAPTAPMIDNPPSASTPEQPNTTEQTPPATPPPAALNTRSPSASDRPAPTPPISNRPPGNPPSARTPEQPQMTDRTPPPSDKPASPTADLVPTPATVTIDINEKATPEVVAKNVEEAKPMAEPSAAVKLKPVAPDLPGSGGKSAHDEGSDKNPATGKMGGRITTDEPQTYHLASGPEAPTHYRAEIDTPDHGGFVAETTGEPVKAAELASALPAGVKATIDTVQIGGQNRTRIGLDWPRSQQVDPTALAASISRAIGAKLGIDTCRRTKPAPALGPEPASASATISALPATVIKLRRILEFRRSR